MKRIILCAIQELYPPPIIPLPNIREGDFVRLEVLQGFDSS
jgi:hypothetical protein